MPRIDRPFTLPLQGSVDANGVLEIRFGPPINNEWDVSKVSIEMPTAPSGSSVELRQMGSLHAPGFSARKASFDNQPTMYLGAGETGSVRWEGCTTGDIGRIFIIYHKITFY